MLAKVVLACALFYYCKGDATPITNIPLTMIFDHMKENTLSQLADQLAADHKFLMYVASSCPYCRNMTKLMATKYPNLNYDYYEWDRQPGGVWLMNDVMKRNNAVILPQIYICKDYVGGLRELRALDESNKLETKVRSC